MGQLYYFNLNCWAIWGLFHLFTMIHIITVCISVGIDVSIFSGAACYTSESRFLLDNNGAVDVPSKYGIPSTLKYIYIYVCDYVCSFLDSSQFERRITPMFFFSNPG